MLLRFVKPVPRSYEDMTKGTLTSWLSLDAATIQAAIRSWYVVASQQESSTTPSMHLATRWLYTSMLLGRDLTRELPS